MNSAKNKVQLIGKIDVPIITITESKLKEARFRVFTYNSYYDNDGEKCSDTMMHNCRAHGKLAEIVENRCSRGMELAVEGFLVTSSYKLRGWTHPLNFVQVTNLLILTQK